MPGRFDPADARQAGAAMGDQCVDQCAGAVSRRRMHHQPGRLVDHDQRIVLVDDTERDVLALWLCGLRGRQIDHDFATSVDAVTWIADRGSVNRDRARQDERFQARAGERVRALRQDTVEPFAFLGGGGMEYVVPDPVGHEYCQ